MKTYQSHGKLLITGEYMVLDGATAFAMPTKFGQSLVVKPLHESVLIWESFDIDQQCWFTATFRLSKFRLERATFFSEDEGPKEFVAERLKELFETALEMNPSFLNDHSGYLVQTHLEFPRDWGLGTSSTLINNIAQWAGIDAYTLAKNTFGGSGYDIACAQSEKPLLYQLIEEKPQVAPVIYKPMFSDQLYFVYLNKKQNSRTGIKNYRAVKKNIKSELEQVSSISKQIAKVSSLPIFDALLFEHEQIIASVIETPPVQQQLFADYFGQTKSLGAWGGDFILATGSNDTPAYFKQKGFETVVPYRNMIL